jgi:hypothetical protein
MDLQNRITGVDRKISGQLEYCCADSEDEIVSGGPGENNGEIDMELAHAVSR